MLYLLKKTDSRRRVIYMFQVFSKTPEVWSVLILDDAINTSIV